jgi:hypothetical protein
MQKWTLSSAENTKDFQKFIRFWGKIVRKLKIWNSFPFINFENCLYFCNVYLSRRKNVIFQESRRALMILS